MGGKKRYLCHVTTGSGDPEVMQVKVTDSW